MVSIGNLGVGGTGKTPLARYVAERLHDMGFPVVVVSRGYGGSAENSGGIVSDGKQVFMDADTAGDEPFMLATLLQRYRIPVVVGSNRFQAGMLAVNAFNPAVVLLDDAFQHLKLKRDVDLVLLDRQQPFGNGHLLPRGPLREPPAALRRSDALITTGYTPPGEDPSAGLSLESTSPLRLSCPVFQARYHSYLHGVFHPGSPSGHPLAKVGQRFKLDEKKVFGFSGIARNQAFEDTLRESGCRLVGFWGFPDHYRYSATDLLQIQEKASQAGAEWLSTTEKDHVRIAHRIELSIPLAVIGVGLDFGDQAASFDRFLAGRLQSERLG